jgi:hypothetical protein
MKLEETLQQELNYWISSLVVSSLIVLDNAQLPGKLRNELHAQLGGRVEKMP